MIMEDQKGVEILDKIDGKEEKGIETLEKRLVSDAIWDEINGEMGSEENSKLNVSIGEERVSGEALKPIGSPPSTPRANGDGTGEKHEARSSSSTPKKGHGLKKWRRIRRDMNNYGGAGSDSSLILKRRHSLNEPSRSRNDTKLKNEAESEDEIETPVPSFGSPRLVVVEDASLAPELVQFAIGMVDSDNSEDRSSKSSTAASAPKPRHEIGFGRERGRLKNQGGMGVGTTLQQRVQRGKGGGGDVEASKKFRGNRIGLQKENSLSSIESDLRSSNVGFARWVSNGKQSERSLNFDGEQTYEAQMRSGYYRENGRVEDLSREDFDGDLLEKESNGRSESFRQSSINSFRQSSGIDPFIGSIVLLQTAQEALELEIQKFAEIGKEAALHNSDDQFEEAEVSSSPSPESHLLELNQEKEQLQYKLEEASTTAKAMETKILKLEAIVNRTQSRKKETCSTYPTPFQEMTRGLESELESLLKKKIEAEIELLIMTRTTQSWKLLAEDQIALFEDQAQMSHKMKETKNRAIKLKDQAHELDSYCEELLQTEKALKLQNKVCKFSLCLFLQLLLLCFAIGLFLIQLFLPSHEVVPT